MLDINHDCLDIFILIHGEVTYDSELAFWLHQTGRPAIIFARILSADSIRPVYVCYVCFPPQALYCTRSSDLALPGCTEYCSWFDWVVSVERRSKEGNLVLRAPVSVPRNGILSEVLSKANAPFAVYVYLVLQILSDDGTRSSAAVCTVTWLHFLITLFFFWY